MNAAQHSSGAIPVLSAEQRDLLEMQCAFGVDAVVAETPLVYRAKPPPQAAPKSVIYHTSPPPPSSTPKVRPERPPAPETRPGRAVREARERAKHADSLEALEAAVADFDGCPLKATASKLVFGSGVVDPAVMIIGEGPGSEEDRRGQPFVGASGRLMLRTFALIGLSRQENLYITNVVYWRPPADRTPSDTEIASCAPFLRRQIALVRPKLIVLVGARATQSLLCVSKGITRMRGNWSTLPPGTLEPPSAAGDDIPALAMFHPAYLFRNHAQKRLFWQDTLNLRSRIDTLGLDVPWPQKPLAGFQDDWKP